ncbi:MAG: HNH endonuclease [Verrucomicrobia bacterium]|nr:HNH endonuclease [Verrucomicrobiota bacterium]
MTIPFRLRRQVVERACGRCEYCNLSQEGQEATFHVDHVVPIAVDGPTTLDNLALACVSCSLQIFRMPDADSAREWETALTAHSDGQPIAS